MENETLKERFLGTIFGQAVGDALGVSTEFMSKQEVGRFYPNKIYAQNFRGCPMGLLACNLV